MNTNIATEYCNLPLAVLTESATNPRRIFEVSALKELAESIRNQNGHVAGPSRLFSGSIPVDLDRCSVTAFGGSFGNRRALEARVGRAEV
jgi:hypothetical protein